MDPILIAVVAAAATAAIVTLLLVSQPRREPVPPTLLEKVRGSRKKVEQDWYDNRHDHWMLPSEREFDRRRQQRRAGELAAIRVTTSNESPEQASEGVVLDRSSGGLGIASARAFAVGVTILVIPSSTSTDVP